MLQFEHGNHQPLMVPFSFIKCVHPVSEEKISVAVAEAGRKGEIPHLGNFQNRLDAIGKLARRLGRQHGAIEFV